jgi:hypothetical protein
MPGTRPGKTSFVVRPHFMGVISSQTLRKGVVRTSAISRRKAPEVLQSDGPRKAKRAQGKPGARCTRGLVCKMHIKRRTRAYRFSGSIRLSLRDGLRLISCSPR